jgi:hypothetical protein
VNAKDEDVLEKFAVAGAEILRKILDDNQGPEATKNTQDCELVPKQPDLDPEPESWNRITDHVIPPYVKGVAVRMVPISNHANSAIQVRKCDD